MDDPVKAKTRQLGGIPPLVALLTHEIPEIHRNACGALRYVNTQKETHGRGGQGSTGHA